MKKTYLKPALLCEELHPEEMLCGCVANSPQYNEVQMCGYTVKASPYASLTYNVFMEEWTACDVTKHVYCYNVADTTIFGS